MVAVMLPALYTFHQHGRFLLDKSNSGIKLLFDMDNSACYSLPARSADLFSFIWLSLKGSETGSRPEPGLRCPEGLWCGLL